jgi:hypothetical protein
VKLGKHGRDRTNVWTYPSANQHGSSANAELTNHPTPKPVELVADALLDVTNRDDIVIDPFAGSGTTIIAAQRTRRTAYAMELDPHYVDLIIRRFERFADIEAIHIATGKTFAELAEDRQAVRSSTTVAPEDGPVDTVMADHEPTVAAAPSRTFSDEAPSAILTMHELRGP